MIYFVKEVCIMTQGIPNDKNTYAYIFSYFMYICLKSLYVTTRIPKVSK